MQGAEAPPAPTLHAQANPSVLLPLGPAQVAVGVSRQGSRCEELGGPRRPARAVSCVCRGGLPGLLPLGHLLHAAVRELLARGLRQPRRLPEPHPFRLLRGGRRRLRVWAGPVSFVLLGIRPLCSRHPRMRCLGIVELVSGAATGMGTGMRRSHLRPLPGIHRSTHTTRLPGCAASQSVGRRVTNGHQPCRVDSSSPRTGGH